MIIKVEYKIVKNGKIFEVHRIQTEPFYCKVITEIPRYDWADKFISECKMIDQCAEAKVLAALKEI